MKKYFVALLVVIAFGCTQDPTLSKDQEISFSMNGATQTHYGSVVSAAKNSTPSVFYSFSGVTSGSSTIQIVIPTPGDTLKTITYHNISGTTLSVNSEVYSYFQPTDFLDITFTSYSGGIVNARFSGKVSKVVSMSPVTYQQSTITNGEIKNVKINY